MNVDIITKEDLEAFKIDLLNQIRELLADVPTKNKRWLRTPEVMDLLGISEVTLQTLRNRRQIPFSKLGGVVFYDIEEINKLLESLKK